MVGTENKIIRNDLFGRFDIYASFDDITAENVKEELNSALVYHVMNMLQEEFLYWYRRGVQPILDPVGVPDVATTHFWERFTRQ